MLGESQLNVYILGTDLTARQRERIQAQMQTALRSLPGWALQLLKRRVEALGARNLPLIIEPVDEPERTKQAFTLGTIQARPAVRIIPRLGKGGLSWGQDLRYLVAKAVGYMAAPDSSETEFWGRWSRAVESDLVRDKAQGIDDMWKNASDRDLLLEMFAAYLLTPVHGRWHDLPSVRAFLDEWR